MKISYFWFFNDLLTVLRFYSPNQTNGIMSSEPVYWASMHILSPETGKCPSWISGFRKWMTVENISRSISRKVVVDPVGVEPATSWSPVGLPIIFSLKNRTAWLGCASERIQLSHPVQFFMRKLTTRQLHAGQTLRSAYVFSVWSVSPKFSAEIWSLFSQAVKTWIRLQELFWRNSCQKVSSCAYMWKTYLSATSAYLKP